MNAIKMWSENTNNAWGFGGYEATFTEYDNGIVFRSGRYCHRHTGTSSCNCVFVRISKEFLLPIRKTAKSTLYITSPNNLKSVSVFVNNSHHVAIAEDVDTFSEYGGKYSLLKKISIQNKY